MITLQADNRILISNTKYTYLTINYVSGVSTVNISNTEFFSVDDFILIGEIGHSDAEIFRILSINSTSGDISLGDSLGALTATIHAHSESSKVALLPYNEIKFFWTAATGTITDEDPVFDTSNPLSVDWEELDPVSYYSTFTDTTHITGFGWFEYRNSVTTDVSQESNPIPYGGFSLNTVATVFSDFESLLNVRELKIVTLTEKFAWLNEALAVLKNKLNLSNAEYTVSAPQTLTIIAGTKEYLLPADFCDLVEITNGLTSPTSTGLNIPFMPVSKALSYGGNPQGGWSNGYFGGYLFGLNSVYYYLRGRYIGFVPTPTIGATYYYTYRAKATRLTSLSDYIDLPDNAFYSLKDFMMYRAKLKFNDPSASTYYQAFSDDISIYIQSAVKRNANLDSWDISPETNT
jgi:hypothetical protein